MEYFEWLMNRIGVDNRDEEFVQLLYRLFDIEYVPITRMDSNRGTNGLILREDYMDESSMIQHESIPWNRDCTILEMLIRLSEDVSDMTRGFISDSSSLRWLKEILKNVGIFSVKDLSGSCNIPERFSGIAMFPTKKPFRKDSEIWKVMLRYLKENIKYV